VGERLARAAMHVEVSEALMARSLFATTVPDPAIGPMVKLFSADRFIEDAADLLDLCAPESLLEGRRGGHATGAAAVEFAYRLSTASSIYGGTSEIMKSIVAQGVARAAAQPVVGPEESLLVGPISERNPRAAVRGLRAFGPNRPARMQDHDPAYRRLGSSTP
jgi:hypothetical protein